MSGGAFDYSFYKVEEFVQELNERIANNESDGYNYNKEVIINLKAISLLSEVTSRIMREAELLYSGDISEEKFINNLENLKTGFDSRFDTLNKEFEDAYKS